MSPPTCLGCPIRSCYVRVGVLIVHRVHAWADSLTGLGTRRGGSARPRARPRGGLGSAASLHDQLTKSGLSHRPRPLSLSETPTPAPAQSIDVASSRVGVEWMGGWEDGRMGGWIVDRGWWMQCSHFKRLLAHIAIPPPPPPPPSLALPSFTLPSPRSLRCSGRPKQGFDWTIDHDLSWHYRDIDRFFHGC